MRRRPLVLLAGWGAPATVWEPVRERLACHFEVHTRDLLSGPAPTGDDLTDARRLSDHLQEGISGAAIWVGWSLGGLLATDIARRYPAKVIRLLLVAANPRFALDVASPFSLSSEVLAAFRSAFRQNPLQAWRRFQSLQCQGSTSARQDLRALQAMAGHDLPADWRCLDYQLGWLQTLDYSDWLEDARVAGWLGGRHDALVPAAAGRHFFGANARWLEDSAHLPFLSEPENFARWVLAQGEAA